LFVQPEVLNNNCSSSYTYVVREESSHNMEFDQIQILDGCGTSIVYLYFNNNLDSTSTSTWQPAMEFNLISKEVKGKQFYQIHSIGISVGIARFRVSSNT